MRTNFQTIYGRLKRLKELRDMERSGDFEFLPKKEVLKLRHEKEKLERNLAGIQDMERVPDGVFVIDTKKEHIAVKEAQKLGIPVVAIVDTNCDPDEVDFVIPGNDDAIRACSLITKVVADALQEGQYLAYQGMQSRVAATEFEREPAAVAAGSEEPEAARRPIQLSEDEAAFFGEPAAEEAASAAEGEPASAGDGTQEPPSPTEGDAEGSAPGTSASWAAPKTTTDEEASTVPDLTGAEVDTAEEQELVEASIDRPTVSPEGEEADDQAASGSDEESGASER